MKETKVCGVCKVEKHLNEFGLKTINKDGKNAYCHICAKKKVAEYLDRKARGEVDKKMRLFKSYYPNLRENTTEHVIAYYFYSLKKILTKRQLKKFAGMLDKNKNESIYSQLDAMEKEVGASKDDIIIESELEIMRQDRELKSRNLDLGSGRRIGGIYFKIHQYTLEGEYIRSFENSREAAVATGANISAITTCARGAIKSHIGYVWSYFLNEEEEWIKR